MSPSAPSPSAGAVVCVGESMILLVPESGSLESDERFVVSVAGAESNVACGLAHLGVPTRWVSRVGADPLGERMVRFVAERGVDATGVVRDPEHPTGVFFKDHAAGRTRVFYYRRDSAAAQLTRADVASRAGEGVGTVHVSGVSLGVSPVLADTVRALIHDRPVTGARVSFDINHRPGLWDAADAASPLLEAAQGADVVLVGQDEAQTLWGAGTPEQVRALIDRPGHVVVKDGAHGATHLGRDGVTFQPAMRASVVEVVGAGDAFAAGFLAGLTRGEPTGVCLRLGHVMAALTIQDAVDLPPLPPAEWLWGLARDPHLFLGTEVTPDLLPSR